MKRTATLLGFALLFSCLFYWPSHSPTAYYAHLDDRPGDFRQPAISHPARHITISQMIGDLILCIGDARFFSLLHRSKGVESVTGMDNLFGGYNLAHGNNGYRDEYRDLSQHRWTNRWTNERKRDGDLRREGLSSWGQVERLASGVFSPPSTVCRNGGFSTALVTGIRVYKRGFPILRRWCGWTICIDVYGGEEVRLLTKACLYSSTPVSCFNPSFKTPAFL